MGKITDKILNILGFEVVEEEEPRLERDKEFLPKNEEKNETSWYSKMTARRQERREERLTEINTLPVPASYNVKMIVSCPSSFENSNKVADHLKNNHCVVVDFNELSVEHARRSLDYLSGVVFAIGGKASRVGSGIFLFVPANVSIEGAVQYMLTENDAVESDSTADHSLTKEERKSLFKTISA
ncbi:cell division protein SepF [Desulfofalx alkaliphila]|uniref:cell division protein SepF n=1 Tax=Desulfofalx alkaliphila TaxID=105483 RepID=UPI00068A8A2A|nr:cell division protein SepF [Desulfofalx alkaliphila]